MAMLNNQMVYIVFMSTPECMAYFYRWHWWPQAAWLPIWVAQSGKRNSKLWTIVSHSTIYPSLYTIYIPFIYHLYPFIYHLYTIYCRGWGSKQCVIVVIGCWIYQIDMLWPHAFFRLIKPTGRWTPPGFWSKVEHCLQTASLEVHPGGLSGGIPMVTTGWWLGAIPFFSEPRDEEKE